VGYAGHQGRKLVWGVGINDNQLPSNLLALGPALDVRVANPFFGLITSGNLATAQLPAHRLMRPYPEFDTVNRGATARLRGGQFQLQCSAGQALQKTVLSGGLMLMTSYQWSKASDNIGETEPSRRRGGRLPRQPETFRIERSLAAHDLAAQYGNGLRLRTARGEG
jgi:hypothetical protein